MLFILIWHGTCLKQSSKPHVIISVREKTIIGPVEPVYSVPCCGQNLAWFRATFCILAWHPKNNQQCCFCREEFGVHLHAGGCIQRPICSLEHFLIYVSCCCHPCEHTASPLVTRHPPSHTQQSWQRRSFGTKRVIHHLSKAPVWHKWNCELEVTKWKDRKYAYS